MDLDQQSEIQAVSSPLSNPMSPNRKLAKGKTYKKLRKKEPSSSSATSSTPTSSNTSHLQCCATGLIVLTFVIYLLGFGLTVYHVPSTPLGLNRLDNADWRIVSKMKGVALGKAGLVPGHMEDDEDDDLKNDEDQKDGGGVTQGDDGDKDVKVDDEVDDIKAEPKKRITRNPQIQPNTLEYELEPLPSISSIPNSTWPIPLLSTQQDTFFTISHPGDEQITLEVPPFWSPPVHDGTLMSREKALKIGTCITPDPEGNFQRGQECPEEERTIFVAIASYRDWQCRHTVESIFLRAKHPERIRVGVVDQIVDGVDVACNEPIKECEEDPNQALCLYINQVDVYTMDAPLSVGPVFARHIGHRLYRGEYYAMQSDAHVTFTQDWDDDIVEQQEETGDEMTVLTTYLTDVVGSIDEKTGESKRHTRPIMCNTDYEGGAQGKHLRHMSQPEGFPTIQAMSQLEPYWAAGFSFSRGHFVVNVPYDLYQPMIFQGEEMSIGIRGFTIGYDFFAPKRSVCFHHYAANNKDLEKIPHFWENSDKYLG